jgi:hypothetical protein
MFEKGPDVLDQIVTFVFLLCVFIGGFTVWKVLGLPWET